MEIVKIPIEELTPDPHNAKDHPAEQIEQIKASIEQFGNADPIGVWGENNLVVEGHGRLIALKELGYKEAECIRLDWLTDEERRAYALAHNQTTMSSGWVPEELDLNLKAIGEIDMSLFGFEKEEGLEEIEVIEDDLPEEPETRAQAGDIWQLGKHRLFCGDSTDPENIKELMAGETVDLLLTDPPYNVDLGGGRGGGHPERPSEAKARHRRTDGKIIKNDNWENAEDFIEFLEKAFTTAQGAMKPGAAFYIWYASTQSENFFEGARRAGFNIRQILIWVKTSFTLCRQDYHWRHEPCLYGWKEGAGHYFAPTRKEDTVFEDWINPRKMSKTELADFVMRMLDESETATTVIHEERPHRSEAHPTMKPIKLLARLIRNSTKEGENVLDTFGGSGSTLITCEQMNRRCFMAELDLQYCDTIIERWERFTGEKAVRINDAG